MSLPDINCQAYIIMKLTHFPLLNYSKDLLEQEATCADPDNSVGNGGSKGGSRLTNVVF